MPLRTLYSIQNQVAASSALNILSNAHLIDGVHTGVRLIMSSTHDMPYLHLIASHIGVMHSSNMRDYLFVLGISSPSAGIREDRATPSPLVIIASDASLLRRATMLTNSKFIGRTQAASPTKSIGASETDNPNTTLPLGTVPLPPNIWSTTILDLGATAYDTLALTDAVQKASRAPIDPLHPPPHSLSIASLLSQTRATLQRITPSQAYDELVSSQVGAPTILVDIRPYHERQRQGSIEGAVVVERNELEWAFDPLSNRRLDIADRYDLRVILIDTKGEASSLGAGSLQRLGLLNATDVIGGYEAWCEDDLPTIVGRGGFEGLQDYRYQGELESEWEEEYTTTPGEERTQTEHTTPREVPLRSIGSYAGDETLPLA